MGILGKQELYTVSSASSFQGKMISILVFGKHRPLSILLGTAHL